MLTGEVLLLGPLSAGVVGVLDQLAFLLNVVQEALKKRFLRQLIHMLLKVRQQAAKVFLALFQSKHQDPLPDYHLAVVN